MPPRKSCNQTSFPIQWTFLCPAQDCHMQLQSLWGFTQHAKANHLGVDLQFPGKEGEEVQLPSSEIDQTSSPPASPNAFSQNWGPSDFDFDGKNEPIPTNLNSSKSESNHIGDQQSVPADFTEFHPFIDGKYINYITSSLHASD